MSDVPARPSNTSGRPSSAPAAPSRLPAPSSWWFRPPGGLKRRHPASGTAHPDPQAFIRGFEARHPGLEAW